MNIIHTSSLKDSNVCFMSLELIIHHSDSHASNNNKNIFIETFKIWSEINL
jgi:hypothetical protein